MITTIFPLLIAIIVVFQPNKPRIFSAMWFAGLALVCDVIGKDTDNLAHYGSAALLDLAIIILTSGISPVPKTVISLHAVCMFSIVTNFIGWATYLNYLNPDYYNVAFIGIYALTLMILIMRNNSNVGGHTLGSWCSCFRFNGGSRISYRRENGEAP